MIELKYGESGLASPRQYGFRKYRSTEMAIERVQAFVSDSEKKYV